MSQSQCQKEKNATLTKSLKIRLTHTAIQTSAMPLQNNYFCTTVKPITHTLRYSDKTHTYKLCVQTSDKHPFIKACQTAQCSACVKSCAKDIFQAVTLAILNKTATMKENYLGNRRNNMNGHTFKRDLRVAKPNDRSLLLVQQS